MQVAFLDLGFAQLKNFTRQLGVAFSSAQIGDDEIGGIVWVNGDGHAPLGPRSGDKTADLRNAICVLIWPGYGATIYIWVRDYRVVWNDDPVSAQSHAVAAVFGIPIDIFNGQPIGK